MAKKKLILSMIEKFKNFKNKLGKWFWVILVVIIIVVWRIVASSNKTVKVQSVKVTEGNLIQSVSTSGRIKADQYSVLTFPAGGKVSAVWVKAGQSVKKGAWIAQLDTIPLNAAYQQALGDYRDYQAQAEQALDSVKGHDKDETFAQKVTRTTAEVNRDNAYNAMLAARNNLANAVITAPFAGIIDTASPGSPGIQVVAAAANYTLVNPDTAYFDAEVVETDLPSLAVGQNVKIKLDAYPDSDFTGKLESIGMVAFVSSTGGNAYHVRISLPQNKDMQFRVGMQGDADIVFNTVSNVKKVLTSAIIGEGDKNFVWVIENGKARKVQIEIGKSSLDETEVVSGLSAGQEVVDSPPTNLKPGQKVSI